jgi:hypothetical protein
VLWFVRQLTGSGAAVGLVILCFDLPGVVTGAILGRLLDRYQPQDSQTGVARRSPASAKSSLAGQYVPMDSLDLYASEFLSRFHASRLIAAASC